jgi:DNA replication licensing factor MCM5
MAANASDKTHSSIDDARRPSVDQSSQQLLAASLPSLEETQRTESFLRSRLCIGIVVNRQRILEEAISQGYSPAVVAKAISVMVTRDEIQERNKGRLIKRIR